MFHCCVYMENKLVIYPYDLSYSKANMTYYIFAKNINIK